MKSASQEALPPWVVQTVSVGYPDSLYGLFRPSPHPYGERLHNVWKPLPSPVEGIAMPVTGF